MHDHILLLLKGSEATGARGLEPRDIWLRCDRRPDPNTRLPWLGSQSPVANDTITLSFQKPDLVRQTYRVTGMTAPRRATVLHVLQVLRIISAVSPFYGVASSNCRWFAQTVFVALARFDPQPAAPPASSFGRDFLKALGRDNRGETIEVERQLSALYPAPPPGKFYHNYLSTPPLTCLFIGLTSIIDVVVQAENVYPTEHASQPSTGSLSSSRSRRQAPGHHHCSKGSTMRPVDWDLRAAATNSIRTRPRNLAPRFSAVRV